MPNEGDPQTRVITLADSSSQLEWEHPHIRQLKDSPNILVIPNFRKPIDTPKVLAAGDRFLESVDGLIKRNGTTTTMKRTPHQVSDVALILENPDFKLTVVDYGHVLSSMDNLEAHQQQGTDPFQYGDGLMHQRIFGDKLAFQVNAEGPNAQYYLDKLEDETGTYTIGPVSPVKHTLLPEGCLAQITSDSRPANLEQYDGMFWGNAYLTCPRINNDGWICEKLVTSTSAVNKDADLAQQIATTRMLVMKYKMCGLNRERQMAEFWKRRG